MSAPRFRDKVHQKILDSLNELLMAIKAHEMSRVFVQAQNLGGHYVLVDKDELVHVISGLLANETGELDQHEDWMFELDWIVDENGDMWLQAWVG